MVDNVKQQITIQGRKKAYSAISNGSNKKHNPGDRAPKKGGFWQDEAMHLMDLLAYKYKRQLSQQQIADAIGKKQSTIQKYLGKRKNNIRPMTKHNFYKLVEKIESPEKWEIIKNEVGNIDLIKPHELSYIVLRNI